MLIEHRIEKGVCIVTINGDITREEVDEVEDYVKPFLKDEAIQGLALNLAQVNILDSTGIGLVVTMLKSLRQREAKLALYHINEKNLAIFKMIQLDKILKLYQTEAEALAYFE